jgi:hypothetical protein
VLQEIECGLPTALLRRKSMNVTFDAAPSSTGNCLRSKYSVATNNPNDLNILIAVAQLPQG